jgi:hypothetical protein
MNRSSWMAWMVVAGLGLGSVLNADAKSAGKMISEADEAIAEAEQAVEEARAAIAQGKELVALIPEDSPLMGEVAQMLTAAKKNWTSAVSALDGAKESAAKISAASSSEIAQDYQLLAKVNASVALSGAKVVQSSLRFVEAAANNKTEMLDIMRVAMNNSLEAADEVQMNYERVKGYIAKKYSK